MQQQATTVAGFTIGEDGPTVLHTGQCVYSGTHYLVARFAFYVGDQAETTVIPLKGFIVQHISEPPQALRDPLLTDAHRHNKSMATGHKPRMSPSLISFSHRYTSVEDLLKRESQ